MRKQVTCLLALAGLFAWSVGAQATPPDGDALGQHSKKIKADIYGTELIPGQQPQAGPPSVPLCGPVPCAYFEDFENVVDFPAGCFLNCLPVHTNGALNTWVATTANGNGACGGCSGTCAPVNAGCTMPSISTVNPFGGIGQNIRHGKLTTAPTGGATTPVTDARVPASGLLGPALPIVPWTVEADIAINGSFTANFRWQPQSIWQGLLTTIHLFAAADAYYSPLYIANNPGGVTPGFLAFDFVGYWGPDAGFPFSSYVQYENVGDPCVKYRCNDGGYGTCIEGDLIGSQCFVNEDCCDPNGPDPAACDAALSLFACDKPCTSNADCLGDLGAGVPDGTCGGRIDYYQGGVLIYTSNIYAGEVPDQFAMFSNNRGSGTPAGMDLDNVGVSYGEPCPAICGNNSIEPGEQCDGTDDGACPGRCVGAGDTGPNGEAECTCVPICTFDEPCVLENGDNGPYISSGGFYLYTPDTPNFSIDTCGSTYDSALQIHLTSDLTPIAFNDDCNDGPYGGGSTPTASCYNAAAGNSCTCVADQGEQLLVWAPHWTGADPPVGSATLIHIDKKLECDVLWENGACCDRLSGTCTDDVPADQCMGENQVYTHNKTCATVECERATGACCDRATGLCTDGVVNDECVGEKLVWSKDELCVDVGCERATGACCDGLSGICTDAVLPEACTGEQQVWSQDTSCSAVSCEAARGACCDTTTGECADGVTLAECSDEGDEWSKNLGCSQVTCEPPFIPTVSEWGLVIMALLLLAGAKVYFGRREESLA
jgi:hypothetical protein